MKLSTIGHDLLLVAAVALGITSEAQNVPDWYDEAGRERNYPSSEYYAGLAYAEVAASEASAIQMAEQAAKAEALSKILMTVKSQTVTSSVGLSVTTDNGFDEKIVERYSSLVQIDVAFKDVPGMQCRHYRHGTTVTAFAYVSKRGLARYYDRRITAELTKIETALGNAEELYRHGEKIKARTTAQSVVTLFAEIENAQRILLAVSTQADIQSAEASALVRRLVGLLAELKNATAIYMDCRALLQGRLYALLGDDIVGSLSKLGVSFVDSADQADWVISIKASVVRESSVHGSYFAWVDGDVAVTKNATGQVVYSSSISSLEEEHPDGIKGGHTAGYSQAARAAYKEAGKLLSARLAELIKQ